MKWETWVQVQILFCSDWTRIWFYQIYLRWAFSAMHLPGKLKAVSCKESETTTTGGPWVHWKKLCHVFLSPPLPKHEFWVILELHQKYGIWAEKRQICRKTSNREKTCWILANCSDMQHLQKSSMFVHVKIALKTLKLNFKLKNWKKKWLRNTKLYSRRIFFVLF